MKRKFWQYVHDRLEDAWHWVYYHKLAGYYYGDLPEVCPKNIIYTTQYINGQGGVVGPNIQKTDICPRCGKNLSNMGLYSDFVHKRADVPGEIPCLSATNEGLTEKQ
jgi:hypothetical protein